MFRRRFGALVLFLASGPLVAGCRTNCSFPELAAIVNLKAIEEAQSRYSEICGNGGYATSLAVLGVPPPGGQEAFIDPSMTTSATPERAGYRFTLEPGAGSRVGPVDCNGKPTMTTYYATATPLVLNETGTRSSGTNADRVVWQRVGGTPPREPFGPPATPVQ